MVLKWSFIHESGEETLYIHCSGLLRDRPLWVGRVVLGRFSWNGRVLSGDSWGETRWLLLWSPGRELFTFVELHFDLCYTFILKCQDTQPLHWDRLYTVTVDSCNGSEMNVFLCNLTKYPYYKGTPYDWTRK